MAFVTYILLSTLLYGIAGHFDPEQLGYTASFAFTIVLLEIGIIKIGCYLLSINNDSQLMDLVAYSGYKFVGIIATLAATTIGSKTLEYLVFVYTFNANAFFLVRIGSLFHFRTILLTLSTATKLKICSPTRQRVRQSTGHLCCQSDSKEPTNSIPICIQLCRSGDFYVVTLIRIW